MTNLVFPRLPRRALELRWETIEAAQTIEELAEQASWYHEKAIYTQTGGKRVNANYLKGVREQILEIAKKHGYPKKTKQAARAAFDRECTKWFQGNLIICDGEALRGSFWAFFTSVLMPDVAKWRFSRLSKERVSGGVRNVFGRLWLRSRYLDLGAHSSEGRWFLLDPLTEDAFVSIFERPGLSADPIIAKAMARQWIATAEKVGSSKMEPINRDAIRNLRAVFAVVNLEALSQDQLSLEIGQAFDRAVENHGK